ncbi:conserved hypothetical protein [Verticillium alfalfae VaMs.102]|uniref:Ribosomal RNA-processing protein 42 n=1 Tax=Verticillium alfalfae (strain VaMs.102 / ATCC MYA-4576 / FGSC 10136) TaxID=526221 RepID=C9SGU9_VERA1|nr:conserved hypothetical protein [Verticillium alfalfae VaMs.102]EEY17571.1 conserved hypothetical protein [Verticillium alfalfae VaMs.102]
MATAAQQVLLSPAELAYLHSSLSLTPPIRPDGRTPTQFRPLTAETGILPGTNGSARVCFSDGTEAIVGIKAELEKTATPYGGSADEDTSRIRQGEQCRRTAAQPPRAAANPPHPRRPLSYPLPLLSLTTHLRPPRHPRPAPQVRGPTRTPMFDDDWQGLRHSLYPAQRPRVAPRPPVTLLGTASSAAAAAAEGRQLRLLSVRTVDPPSRLTSSGVPNSENPATSVSTPGKKAAVPLPGVVGYGVQQGVWRPPVGGTKFAVLEAMIGKVLEKGGVADEVLDGLEGVDLVQGILQIRHAPRRRGFLYMTTFVHFGDPIFSPSSIYLVPCFSAAAMASAARASAPREGAALSSSSSLLDLNQLATGLLLSRPCTFL